MQHAVMYLLMLHELLQDLVHLFMVTSLYALQGSSEYNITVLIDQKDSERALRAVHSRFYLSDVPIGVGIVGPGLIGGTLIEQLREQVGLNAQPICMLACLPAYCACFFFLLAVYAGWVAGLLAGWLAGWYTPACAMTTRALLSSSSCLINCCPVVCLCGLCCLIISTGCAAP
jgi:hypothetical protein